MKGAEFWVEDEGFEVQGLEFRVECSNQKRRRPPPSLCSSAQPSRSSPLASGVYDFGLRVWGLGLRIQGLGFRV